MLRVLLYNKVTSFVKGCRAQMILTKLSYYFNK